MNFLVDAQLPPALCTWLRARGHEAEHVSEVLGGQTPDHTIARFADTNSLTLISKDEDFVMRHPPERHVLIWLRCGNVTNKALISWLEPRWTAIEACTRAGDRLVEVR